MPATKCTLTQEQAIDVRMATEALQASKAAELSAGISSEEIKHRSALEFAVTQLLAVVADLTGGARS